MVETFLMQIHQAGNFNPYHISLYTAMLSCWQEQAYQIPFRVTRKKLMALSGIRSIATYHDCLRVLTNRNFILYEPSYSKRTASQITLQVLPDRFDGDQLQI
jgi:hypothetical protein